MTCCCWCTLSESLCVSVCSCSSCPGVVVYDFEGPQQEPRVLLVREKTGTWNLPAGQLVSQGPAGSSSCTAWTLS